MTHTNYVYSNKQTTLPLKTITTTRPYLSTQNMTTLHMLTTKNHQFQNTFYVLQSTYM